MGHPALTIIHDDDLSDLIARALGTAADAPPTTRHQTLDLAHQAVFTALRGKLAAVPIKDILHSLFADPHARTSTTALALIGVLRQEIADAAGRESDPDEAQRLKNLAACLPVWGA